MKRVLVIDDNNEVRRMISSSLELYNYNVTDINSGDRATEVMSQKIFDLIICDLFMPDKDGIETILSIRKKYSSVPIILITGGGRHFPRGGDDLKNLLLSIEFFDVTHFLMKPFRPSQLVSLVEHALSSAGPRPYDRGVS
ncbi:response regulator [Tabrizicola sp. WMC-M-20]|nr:response regulator [Tabrizicola sp. WMC-M-20]